MTKVPGQGGPYFSLTERECAVALKAILEREGAENLVEELHRWMRRRTVADVASLFDAGGMTYGPASVVHGLKAAVESGIADNYTYHFAMTAIVYAMALEKLDPEFFKQKKHVSPPELSGRETRRQGILEYVRRLAAPEDTTS